MADPRIALIVKLINAFRRVVEEGFNLLDTAPKVLGGVDLPLPFSPPLEHVCVPQKETIISAIKALVGS